MEQVCETINDEAFKKSENDVDRTYRSFKLQNGLSILLVSDATTKTAAATMSVGIGGTKDPPEVPGLAHFIEHMLFLGTERYPEESAYSNFISTHGGTYNASTDYEFTSFYFSVAAQQLEGALDRFSAFFVCPLFTESCTDREVNAVHQEFEKNLLNDLFRENRLLYSLIADDHPLNKFVSGNRETLVDFPAKAGVSLREELFKFYQANYSSHIMCLTVLGKESLDELEQIVVPRFAPIRRNDAVEPIVFTNPFAEQNQLRKEIRIVPIRDRRVLDVSFNVPYSIPHYKTNPDSYVSHLLGHEGSGSLLRYLQDRNWVLSLTSYGLTQRGFETFHVKVELTESGLESVYDIITALFQYVKMMQLEGPQQRIYSELQTMTNWSFRFQEKSPETSLAMRTAKLMHYVPVEDVLKFGNFYEKFDPALIIEYVNCLNPDNMQVVIKSKTFSQTEPELEQEKFFGTKFIQRSLPEEWLQTWRNCLPIPELFLPNKNPYIPESLTVPIGLKKPEVPSIPTVEYESELCRLWYKLDDQFFVPKSNVQLLVRVPSMTWHPLYDSLGILYLQLLEHEIQEMVYEAELAGINSGAAHNYLGFEISFKGLSEKIPLLVNAVVDKMASFTPSNEEQFQSYKDQFKRSLENNLLAEPYRLANNLLNQALLNNYYSVHDLLHFIDDCTFEKLKQFMPQMMSSIHLEFMVLGVISRDDAVRLCKQVESSLKDKRNSKPLLLSEKLFRWRCMNFPEKSQYFYGERSIAQPTYALCSYFQVGPQTIRSSTIVDLYCQVLSDRIMDEVRTKKQLGYVVFQMSKRVAGVQGIMLLLQSSSPIDVCDAAFECFIKSVPEILSTMTEEVFADFKKGLEKIYLEKPKRLSQEALQYWEEVLSGHYNFRRNALCAQQLASLTLADLLTFHNLFVCADAPGRRKLALAILPATPDATKETIRCRAVDLEMEAMLRKCLRGDEEVGAEGDQKQQAGGGTNCEVVKRLELLKHKLPLYPTVKSYAKLNHC